MTGYIKGPHKTIFAGPTGCEKTHLVLDLIKKEYNKHFDYIINLCPTLWWNKTCHAKTRIKYAVKVWLVEPKSCHNCYHAQTHSLLSMILSLMKALIKKRQSWLGLAISGRHRHHYLWLLTQSCSVIPKKLRRHTKAIFVWYSKERGDLKMIHDENNVLTDDGLVVVTDFSRTSKHACLYIPNENPREFNVLNRTWGDHFLEWGKNDSLHVVNIPLFTVRITRLVEYRCFFISRPDLFCNGKYLVAPSIETSVL